MRKPPLLIVTPALAAANNGNWQTARRWAGMLAGDYAVRIAERLMPGDADAPCALIALHARKSAAAVQAWREAHPTRPLVLVLTGTDLYRDIATDAAAQRSLALADRLVVLNDLGAASLPPALRGKACVIVQSAPARRPLAKTARHLRALMVGHLREEKSPRTYFGAARALARREDILFDHIGGPLDAALADEARALMRTQPRYRWLGALPHGAARARIQAAHVLVHPSVMEGGAHVVIEAVASGTPVLASRIDGNVGLLGAGYGGYFEPGDAKGLAGLIERARDDAAMLPALARRCDALAPRFAPERERDDLRRLLAQLMTETER